MLGDNSPRSKDSRGWDNQRPPRSRSTSRTVPGMGRRRTVQAGKSLGDMLTGKAFFIYWPHGKPIGPESGSTAISGFRSGLTVERMKWIR